MIKTIKAITIATLCILIFTPSQIFAAAKANNIDAPSTISQIFTKVKENNNWKLAFLTGKNAQIVFMNVSPKTNPKNEIGVETHKFDQIIFIVEGNAKVILNGKISLLK